MAIELRLSKQDSEIPWGFRLVGGAEYTQPLVVVKVFPNSIAENSGLMIGDVLVRINETATAGLTHVAAHDLIRKTGNDLVVAVRRGLFSDIRVVNEDDGNVDVDTILGDVEQKKQKDLPSAGIIGGSPNILENLAGQEQVVDTTDREVVEDPKPNKRKKWSTFLVKPKNPKPIPKKKEEERKIIGEPYRVKIVKQPKRDPNDVLNHKKTVHFESEVTKVEFPKEEDTADSIAEGSITSDEEVDKEGTEEDIAVDLSVTANEETIMEIEEVDYESDKNSDTIENDSLECLLIKKKDKKPKPILKPTPIDIHIDTVDSDSLPLEEQLAAVQKQLLALSNLPSAIQVTLEAVTQQLNKIVSEKLRNQEINHDDHNDDGDANSDGEEVNNEEMKEENEDKDSVDENGSTSENAEEDITENEPDENHNIDELDEDYSNDEKFKDESDEEAIINACKEADPYYGLTEEEKEAKIKEEQLLAKKQKQEEEERRLMDWTQRPIILPGGRKWCDPEDTIPKYRTLKMSDEKICKTIEDYSEVLVGKTKGSTNGTGINFLKYQPPPKNLDYLQKSEVYRLVHGMEPPLRGVGARAEKILSENDYYRAKGTSP
ncbi:hypothetical protein GWI33_020403 [Rhynchophorus ferrugineus]|uniref:PDZ domain-containing protein n=1 Tax=Rhynchophorus ferrugineus TaxID=354439 RepID=A0A834HRF8_RHYFE|nr:hypothetical protein GWI33_020403 [Rhynchophorus ferrugineus]